MAVVTVAVVAVAVVVVVVVVPQSAGYLLFHALAAKLSPPLHTQQTRCAFLLALLFTCVRDHLLPG